MPDSITSNLIDIYVRNAFGDDAVASATDVEPIDERARRSVHRIDLDVQVEGRHESISVLSKATTAQEIEALRLLNQSDLSLMVPELLASHEDDSKHFVLMLHYEGVLADFGEPVPRDVIETLARVHCRYEGDERLSSTIPRADADYMRDLIGYCAGNLDVYPAGRVRESVKFLRDNVDALIAKLSDLPLTLTHWDIHPGNIIKCSDGRAILIDWGNARIGPKMIDLANLIEWDSHDCDLYIAEWERCAGRAMDRAEEAVGYQWAKAMTNLKYLPYAVEHSSPYHVARMVNTARASLETFL